MDFPEQILEQILSLLFNNTTCEDRVYRGRLYDTEKLPALLINGGDDIPVEELLFGKVDSEFSTKVTIIAKGNDVVGTELNDIRRQVYGILMSNRTLNLPFVHQVQVGTIDEPANDIAEQQIFSMEMAFPVLYRHSITDMDK